MSLNRNEFPPQGWRWYQPETKWQAPNPLGDNFDATVDRIRNHRIANAKFKLTTDRLKIAAELEAFTLQRRGIVMPPLPDQTRAKSGRSGGCGSCSKRK